MLAMGRRRDMPAIVANITPFGHTPAVAIGVIGLIVALMVMIGDIKLTWSFSAFTVLVYYAITNFAALKLPNDKRLYPSWVACVGLVSCIALVIFIDRTIWVYGGVVTGLGAVWFLVAEKGRRSKK